MRTYNKYRKVTLSKPKSKSTTNYLLADLKDEVRRVNKLLY